MSEPTEREQRIQEYLDGHISRGGLLSDEIRMQAAAYADRIVQNRAYEQQMRAVADKQREQLRIAESDAALRERSNRKTLEDTYLNRILGENVQITAEHRKQATTYAERVLAQRDPLIERRAMQQAAQRLAAGREARAARCQALRAELARRANSNHYKALREEALLLRQALDDLDAELFREAMRPQGTPQESGEDSAVPARGRRHKQSTVRNDV